MKGMRKGREVSEGKRVKVKKIKEIRGIKEKTRESETNKMSSL